MTIAKKEFLEETGQSISGEFLRLPSVKQKGGKTIHAWLVKGDFNENDIISNTFTMEWPPRSGKQLQVPEVDRGGWFRASEAKIKLNAAQIIFIDEATQRINRQGS